MTPLIISAAATLSGRPSRHYWPLQFEFLSRREGREEREEREGGFVFDDHKIPRAGRDREESHISHPVVRCTGRQSAVDHPP